MKRVRSSPHECGKSDLGSEHGRRDISWFDDVEIERRKKLETFSREILEEKMRH